VKKHRVHRAAVLLNLTVGLIAAVGVLASFWKESSKYAQFTYFASMALCLIGLCVLAVVDVRVLRKRRRLAAGLCPACGYDLRASKDRCPECGLAIMPQKRGES
jgi:hypothetical protein